MAAARDAVADITMHGGDMRLHTRQFAATVVAVLALTLGVGSASGNRLSVSSKTFRYTWSALTFSNAAEGVTVRCAVTLEGSFHSATIVKSANALVGYVTRSALNACSGAEEVSFNNEALPWHLRYSSFTGTLPNITGVKMTLNTTRIWFRHPVSRQWCHYRAPVGTILNIGAGGAITGVRADETLSIEAAEDNDFTCPRVIGSSGTGNVGVLGTTTTISVRLI